MQRVQITSKDNSKLPVHHIFHLANECCCTFYGLSDDMKRIELEFANKPHAKFFVKLYDAEVMEKQN